MDGTSVYPKNVVDDIVNKPIFSKYLKTATLEQGEYLIAVSGGAELNNIYGLYYAHLNTYASSIQGLVVNGAIGNVTVSGLTVTCDSNLRYIYPIRIGNYWG